MRSEPWPTRSRTRGQRTATAPMPVMISRSGRCPCRTSRWRPSSVTSSACLLSKAPTSASTACASSARAPSRKTSVSGSVKVPGWESWKTLVSVTAYHSFSGEVEASNTPTIRRLTPSCRHQLSPIAPFGPADANLLQAHLNNANLLQAQLNNANLKLAELNNASLELATLNNAYLSQAALNNADLSVADLNNADLGSASLTGARLAYADLTDEIHAPVSAAPDPNVAGIKGLPTVRIPRGDETGMVQLRDLLQKAGLRDLERQATFTIEYWRTRHATVAERYFR